MRHGNIKRYDPGPGVSISTLAYEYPSRFNVPEHAHGSDQLIYATVGDGSVGRSELLADTSPSSSLDSSRNLASNSHARCCFDAHPLSKTRTRPSCAAFCTVLHVSPLLCELVLEAVRIGQLRTKNHIHRAFRDLIVHQLHNASPVPMFVKLPTDSRALGVAQAFMANQANAPSLHTLTKRVGVSVRTIERIFRREVGMSFEFGEDRSG